VPAVTPRAAINRADVAANFLIIIMAEPRSFFARRGDGEIEIEAS